MEEKKILLGITGGIAAYKTPLLIRQLVRNGASVQVVVTDGALDFVTPLTLSTVSGNPILSDLSDEEGNWNDHVALGSWADLFVIAPATANTLGKMANGICDNLLLATYFSAKCPVLFAPAMDLDMWKHPAVQKNVETLQGFGHQMMEPEEGELASGLVGKGRMPEPETIYQRISELLG